MIKKHQQVFNIFQVTLDAVTLSLAYVITIAYTLDLKEIDDYSSKYLIGAFCMVPLLLVVYYFMDVYYPRRSRPFRKEALLIIRAHLVGIVLFDSFFYLNKSLEYSRKVSIVFALSGLFLLLLERYIVRETLHYFRMIGYNQKHMLIIGAGPVGMEFAGKVLVNREFGYNVVGFLDDDVTKHDSLIMNKPVLGSLARLPDLLANQPLDEVVVALPLHASVKYGRIVAACDKAGVRLRIIPAYYNFFSGSFAIEEFDGIPLLNIRRIPLNDPINKFIKRFSDLVIAAIAIILFGPLMICIAIGIKLTSPGPVFFHQERTGRNNRLFYMLKFRSMRIGTVMSAATQWTTADDPRKTKFGAFLRKTSLDELPQFFNVLFGSMSVIGPRPERPFFVHQFMQDIPKYMVKHQVKPGITGWAQVNGWRGDTSIEKRIECDIYYIENWDLLFDVKILLMTVIKGLVNKNAY